MRHSGRRRFLRQLGWGALSLAADRGARRNSPWVPRSLSMNWLAAGQTDPIVRVADLLRDCSPDRVVETVLSEWRRGIGEYQLLASVLLAGVREVRPRPAGSKAHAMIMVGSVSDLMANAAPNDRILPVLFNAAEFKRSQARDIREGDWRLSDPPTTNLPDKEKAAAALEKALETWHEDGADRAVTALFALGSVDTIFEVLWPYGARDFIDIGHKVIYSAQVYRAIKRMGWGDYALPVLRSLVYGLLRGGPGETNAIFERNRLAGKALRAGWQRGNVDPAESRRMLERLRTSTPESAADLVIETLNRGIDPASAWDGMRLMASEQLWKWPQLLSVHSSTATNAMFIAYQATQRQETKRILLLQAASWQPMYRDALAARLGAVRKDSLIDLIQPFATRSEAIRPSFDREYLTAAFEGSLSQRASAILTLAGHPQGAAQVKTKIHELLFRKGTTAHQFKYAAAVLQDFGDTDPDWATHLLAVSCGYLPHAEEADSGLYRQARDLLSQ